MPKKTKTTASKARAAPYDASKRSSTPAAGQENNTAEPAELEAVPKAAITNYLFQVRLLGIHEPCITRVLTVPSNFTFRKFHLVLQAAFGWGGCHMYSFDVSKLETEEDEDATPASLQLLSLSNDDKSFYPDADKYKKDSDYTLGDIYDGEEYKGKVEVSYEYDHGDSWNHAIIFLGRADPVLRQQMHIPDKLQAACIGGEGHACAEDCGSTPGWAELKRLFGKGGGRDHNDLRKWYKTQCVNGDPTGLDPYKWDIYEINNSLSRIQA